MYVCMYVCIYVHICEAFFTAMSIFSGRKSLPLSMHPKRDRLLCYLPDIHPDTMIIQYIHCYCNYTLLINTWHMAKYWNCM